MQKFNFNQFDGSTFDVIAQKEQREIYIYGNYEDWADAKERPEKIVSHR
jgi:hypothetical protein